ncbi:phosphatase PAP2 family protein [Pollutibacter soli]|uniref:phosphatase PAP2 family protein n=1 Tax=Pollutibacter soli TaxID=3034157 RepID=UPI0030141D7C
MKKLFFYLSAIAAVFAFGYSCSKNVEYRTQNAPALQPSKNDENAGNWKPVLLTAPDEFAVPAPGATGTPDYIAQINEMKSWQQNMSKADQQSVKYWSAGAVLRWNEILRELVAKFNLPPYQNPDGTYPVPNAANPLAYPYFPFANPPYAARAYAYVSAAQYDALIAAFHYKKLYNRKAPYAVDSSVKTLVPRSDLSSYPSEDAVVAGAASEMMKLLFPGSQDYINKKMEEHVHARMMAGVNVRSDIDAGLALGRAVAQKFIARGRTDRAGAAGGNAAMWKQLEDDCIARGETPWYSLETPKRPPMLPAFGKVKSLLLDSMTLISLRPGPPPSTNSELMGKEIKEIYDIVTKPTREQIAIVHHWADGVGTSTPPGHWNEIAAEDWIKEKYSEPRWARNMALLNIAMMDAAIVCWDTKYFYFNPRPSQMDKNIKTATGVPNFPAYISGHSTFSGAAATILGHILPSRANAYDAMATEASLSRMYGGIHYRSDCEKGLEVGINIGAKAVDRAKIDGAE